jgi:hypothetical protein
MVIKLIHGDSFMVTVNVTLTLIIVITFISFIKTETTFLKIIAYDYQGK